MVTGFLDAMTLNMKVFSDNAIPRGILHLIGDYSQEDLSAFKNYWNAQVRGVNNAWAMPVMASSTPEPKVTLDKVRADFNDRYFSPWLTVLT